MPIPRFAELSGEPSRVQRTSGRVAGLVARASGYGRCVQRAWQEDPGGRPGEGVGCRRTPIATNAPLALQRIRHLPVLTQVADDLALAEPTSNDRLVLTPSPTCMNRKSQLPGSRAPTRATPVPNRPPPEILFEVRVTGGVTDLKGLTVPHRIPVNNVEVLLSFLLFPSAHRTLRIPTVGREQL